MTNTEQILKETIGIELFINMDSNLKLLIYEAMKDNAIALLKYAMNNERLITDGVDAEMIYSLYKNNNHE
jgi:hypothetical protein